jgi:4-amino-4-deoxy-L-arabinose transferase-like glycosyltransferase
MHGRTAVRAWPPAAARMGFIVLATALLLSGSPAPAATTPPTSGDEASITVKALPPSVQVDSSSTDEGQADNDGRRGKRHRAVIRLDSDRDFESFKDAIHTTPWIVGLVFLVVGSIFLTPIILLIGIVWYKLRKTRMQNDALLKLAETGVVPASQAVESVTSGVMPVAGAGSAAGAAVASAAQTSYQDAVAARRRVVWSDLRKGVLISAVGLSFTIYSMIEKSAANWVGLVLLFVGVGYIVLWWFEDRQFGQRNPPGASG